MKGMLVTPVGYTFANPDLLGPLEAHVEGFVKMGVEGVPKRPLLYVSPHAATLERVAAVCREKRIALAVDVETSPPDQGKSEWALLPGYAKLRAFGVGIALGSGIGLSWMYPAPVNVWSEFKRLMADPRIPKVWCNGISYDMPILERYGVTFGGQQHDIRDSRRALVSLSRTSLSFQVSIYYPGVKPWKVEATSDDSEKGYVDASRIKRSKLLRYNAEDCVRTAQVRSQHVREFKEDPADRIRLDRLYRQQLRLARCAARMSYRGFPVDEGRRRQLRLDLTVLARDRAAELRKLISKRAPAFRITETGGVNETDLAALVYKDCRRPGINGFDLEVPLSDRCRTDGGKPAVNRNALLFLSVQDNCPDELKAIMRAVWRADSPLKARSTYIDSDKVLSRIGPDGRMHASINSCGTETGRWSCSNPNLFNLSEVKEESSVQGALPNVRGMYCAGKGRVIVHRDYKGLELAVMQDYTGDKVLRKMLSSGDAHNARVQEWFGIPEGAPIPKQLRSMGKSVGFASNYGSGLETVFLVVLALLPDAKFEDIARLHALFKEKHTGIVEHWVKSVAFAETHGFNETFITNRRRYYPPGFPLSPTETSNYAIQGTAADIANGCMVGTDESDYPKSLEARLARYFPSAWLAMHTYDSFDVICDEKDGPAVNELMDECMRGPWDAGAGPRDFLSDGKIGYFWSDV